MVGAFQNTADTLHAIWADGDARARRRRRRGASQQQPGDRASGSSAAGRATALAVLGAEQTEHQTRLALLQARAARYDDVAALFQALGGGWWNSDAPLWPADAP